MTHKTLDSKDFKVKSNCIKISPYENWVRYFWIFSFFAWIIFGTSGILKYLRTNDSFSLWSGTIMLLLWSTAGIVAYCRKSKNEILFKNIEKIKLRLSVGEHYIVEVLCKDNTKRQVLFSPRNIKVLIADLESNGLTVEKEEE